MDKQVVISIKTIVISLLLLLGLFAVYNLRSVIGLLLVSILIVVAVEPLVKYFSSAIFFNKPLPRGFAVLLAYLFVIITFIVMFTVGLPPVITQSQKLILGLGPILEKANINVQLGFSLKDLIPQITNVSGNLINIVLSIFSNIATILTVLFFSIYISLDWLNLKNGLFSFLPDSSETAVREVFNDVEVSIGQWVKGQLILMFTVGVMSYIGLVILDVDYPLALALISGFLEVVPVIGPVMSGFLAAIIGFSISPIKGLGVIALYLIVQQLENNLLVPKVMQQVSGFSPLVVMVALMVGGQFFGLAGVILAVPVTMILVIVLKKVLRYSGID